MENAIVTFLKLIYNIGRNFNLRVIQMLKSILKTAVVLGVGICLASCGENGVSTSQETVLPEDSASVHTKRTVTVSCVGDCTLGSDDLAVGRTMPVELDMHNNDYGWFLQNVQGYLADDDLTIANLEGPITQRGERKDKEYSFHAKKDYVNVLLKGSVEAVTLANNHALDYGEEGLLDTKETLTEAGIAWVENMNTRVLEVKGVKIGLVGVYGLNGGAAGLMPKAIKKVRDEGAEVIVVSAHWGTEGECRPNGTQINLAHSAIDAGADLVVGHHPHILQGVEKYNGKMIAYSLGNFCFGGNKNPPDKDTMIFVQNFTLSPDGTVDCEDYQIVPCLITSQKDRNNYQPTPAIGEDALRIREKIETLSKELGTDALNFSEGARIL